MLLAIECFKCGFKAGDSAGSAVTVGSAREELSVLALFLHLQGATQDASVGSTAFLCAFSHGHHVTAEKFHLCCRGASLQLMYSAMLSVLLHVLHLQLELEVFLWQQQEKLQLSTPKLCLNPPY